MLKTIGIVIVSYIVVFVVVFLTLTGSYLALGAESVFLPGSYAVTPLWVAISLVFGVLSAIAGGWVCAALSKKKSIVNALAVLVFILGLLNIIPVMMASKDTAVRTGDVPNLQAMMNGREPVWYALLLPFIGVAGVMIGGRSKHQQP